MPAVAFFMLNLSAYLENATTLTILLAFIGYLATFMSARMLARRRDKLRLVNKRLNEFYGPLFVATQAGFIAYRSLLKKQGKTQSEPITDEEMKEWVLWMTTIFMPLNDIREKIIIEKAYLIVEEQMPVCLLEFVTHVVGYKAVVAKWAEGDFSERRSTIGWPPEFDVYIKRSYAALKAEQTRLVHDSAWSQYMRFFRRKRR
jgi:amino acid transporter